MNQEQACRVTPIDRHAAGRNTGPLVAATATASDGAVVHHHSPPPVMTGHRDNKRKRRTYYSVNDDARPPQELIPAVPSTINANRGGTEPATHTSHRHDKALSSSVARAPPASSKAIRVKNSSSSFVIGGGGGGKQRPGSSPGGGGGHSYYASNHAAAAPSPSRRLIVLGPAAPPPPPPPHLPAKARRPPTAPAVQPERIDDNDGECFFRRGVEVFGEWDAATQQAAVEGFVRQHSPPEGDGFSFWLTPAEAEDDLEYVREKVEEARRTRTAAAGSGSGKPRRH